MSLFAKRHTSFISLNLFRKAASALLMSLSSTGSAVLQAAGNRVRPDPRGNNVLSPFFFGSLKFSAFSVHQPEKVALLPEDQKEVSSVMAGNGPYHVSSQKRHRRRSPTWVRISGSPFVMRIEFS